MSREAHDPRGLCMINRRTPRVVANACIDCGLSLIACQAQREYDAAYCCTTCNH